MHGLLYQRIVGPEDPRMALSMDSWNQVSTDCCIRGLMEPGLAGPWMQDCRMQGSMDPRIRGQLDPLMGGPADPQTPVPTDGWIRRRLYPWTGGSMDPRTATSADSWADGFADGCIRGWVNPWTRGCSSPFFILILDIGLLLWGFVFWILVLDVFRVGNCMFRFL